MILNLLIINNKTIYYKGYSRNIKESIYRNLI